MHIPKLLISGTLLLFAISLNAQRHLIGVKGGVNITDFASDGAFKEADTKVGFVGGLTYQFVFNEQFLLGAETLFNRRGVTIEQDFTDEVGNPTGSRTETDFDLDYLSIPITFGVSYGEYWRLNANIAVVPSFLLDARFRRPRFVGNTEGLPQSLLENANEVDVTDEVSGFDFATRLEVGGGYMLTDLIMLHIDVGYQHSISTFTNSEFFADTEARHRGVNLTFGIKYML